VSSSRFSRRDALVGAAGLLIGGGATEAAHALTGSNTTAKRAASPGEELMTEHGVLKRILLSYRAAGDQLAQGKTPPATAVTDAAQIVSDYIESFHEGLEEAYVFPRVRAQQPDLITTLLVQHDRGRHLTASILKLSAADLRPAATRDALATAMGLFVRMYEPHEAWEDTVVYPALRQSTPQHTLDELAERFAELENKQYGDAALAQLLQRVQGIEEQLDIGNLADFTPPSSVDS
jgi:hemerythrin-like domain-containing protein